MGTDTAVTLHFSVAEEYVERHYGEKDTYPIVNKVNDWLEQRNFGTLISVEDNYGGSRIPSVVVMGGAYRDFPDREFAKFILALPWEAPEHVVLVLQPDQTPTQVYRPDFQLEKHIGDDFGKTYFPSLGNQVPG